MKYTNIVFRKKNYIIIHQFENKYLIINTDKDFNEGHTHVFGLAYAKLIVFTILDKKLKQKHIRMLKNKNFIKSLERLTSPEYVDRIIRRTSI